MLNDLNKGIIQLLEEGKENRFEKPLIAITQLNEALNFLSGKEKLDPLFDLADAYVEVKDYESGKSTYEEILKIDPTNPGGYYGLAYTNELGKGDIKDSLDFYEKAIELDKNYKEAYYYAATIYGDMKNYDKAIDYLKKTINLDPNDFIAYNDLGAIYETLGKYDEALEYLNKSIDKNEEYYLSRFNKGVVYKALKEHDKAIEQYKIAKNLSDNIYIFLNMSAIYIEDREYEKAIDILTEGINRNPHHILLYNRACTYSKLGDEKKALEDFMKAMEIDDVVLRWGKDDPDLEDIIRRNYDNIKN